MFISKKYYNYNLLVLVYFHELKMTIGKWKLFHSTYQILIIVLEKEKKIQLQKNKNVLVGVKNVLIPIHPHNVYR